MTTTSPPFERQHENPSPTNLDLPSAFLEARFCSGTGQYHSDRGGKHPRPYDRITGHELVAMLGAPDEVAKSKARWIIFSSLPSRVGDEQRQRGEFYALWADLDTAPLPIEHATSKAAEAFNTVVLGYTSKSATQDRQKGRLIVPLAEPCSGSRFEACQRILNDRLAAVGITPDRATERASQICYLPNRGDFYAVAQAEGLLALGPLDWSHEFAGELAAYDREEAERLEALERRQAEARAKLAERQATGQASPIAAYKATHPLTLVLEASGYTQHGDRWLSPYSESGAAGVTITKDGATWHTDHHSDRDAGLPEWGDAFDLCCHFEHDGDRDAALRAIGAMMTTEDGRTLTEFNQDRYREAKALEMFEDLGDPEYGEDIAADLENTCKPQRRSFGFTPMDALVAELRPIDWLIKGYIEADSLALVYGEPGHGKSFLAIDWAASVATGQPWHGNATRPGAVFYVAGEGHNGLTRRLRAWSDARGINAKGVPLFVSNASVSLTDPAAALEVLRAVDGLAKDSGQAPALIVVDTLARNFGGDENSATDMGAFIAHLDALRRRWRATVLVVHHSGKDKAKGARGSTALRGAVDTEYGLAKDAFGVVTLDPSKMKDAEMPPRLSFTLESVKLPLVEEDGEEAWSCVLTLTDRPDNQSPVEALGKNQRKALETLRGLAKGIEPDEWGAVRLSVSSWRESLGEVMTRKAFYEAKKGLAQRGFISIEGESVSFTP